MQVPTFFHQYPARVQPREESRFSFSPARWEVLVTVLSLHFPSPVRQKPSHVFQGMTDLSPLPISCWLLFLIDQPEFFTYSESTLSNRNKTGATNTSHILNFKCSGDPMKKSSEIYFNAAFYLTQHIPNMTVTHNQH